MDQVDSRYGFISVDHSQNQHDVEIFLPQVMLDHLQIVQGSSVLVQGLSDQQSQILNIRAGKPSTPPKQFETHFIATLRFPNREGILHQFLTEAAENKIGFELIRTQGLRGEVMADVLCEGVVTPSFRHFDPAEAIALELQKAAKAAGGAVIAKYPINYTAVERGLVVSTSYVTYLPVLRGRYGKVNISTQGKSFGRVFKNFEGELHIVRTQVDLSRMIITIDISFSELIPYTLSFKATDLDPASPITEAILETLYEHTKSGGKEKVNIDAVEAYEYPEYHPNLAEEHIRPTATIEILFTSKTPLKNLKELASLVTESLNNKPWCGAPPKVEIIDLNEALKERKDMGVPEKLEWSVFRKYLHNERYAFVDHLGDGGFGYVNKYFDLKTMELVAGKYITRPTDFNKEEINVLRQQPLRRVPAGM